jgi:GntR family transcriptional regulator
VKKMIFTEIQIDFASPVPVYEQIKRNIKQAIARNILNAKDFLPSVREMASFLKINPTTVVRSYRELQQEGIIGARAGKGFWVEKSETTEKEKTDLIRDEFLRVIEKGVELGLSSETLKGMVNDFFREDE